tara:strand:- start:2061 stop:2267 length:207 start_codon:yes stop_codon:yes gene_type:complete
VNPLELTWDEQLLQKMNELGWERTDLIDVQIAGSQVYEIEGDGTRWKPNKGTRKYNKDAFIVLKRHEL